jgi:hypothetical protein
MLRGAEQIRAGDMVMNPDFSTAPAAEIFRMRFIS